MLNVLWIRVTDIWAGTIVPNVLELKMNSKGKLVL